MDPKWSPILVLTNDLNFHANNKGGEDEWSDH